MDIINIRSNISFGISNFNIIRSIGKICVIFITAIFFNILVPIIILCALIYIIFLKKD
jgi:hypothetical protein